ncbi:hypothetical protein UPYG_G00006330 [Umbra pygmaea]|uniref:Uncharacterized protein n=1 Tax=Umbra pygmaea TaxID=75934 RepID=A0ABD0XHJ5_UMBPY
MDSPNEMSLRFHSYSTMYSYDKRLDSFADWPFREECQCTPEMMAKAGFVHCPIESEPDVACCFFCLKELEGWEPEDNPWSEHVKRSPNCGFLTLKKDFCQLTVAEFYHLEQERVRIYIRKAFNQNIANFRDQMVITCKCIQTLFDSPSV